MGVYAATNSFSVQVQNEININVLKVDGTLYGKRGGDVIKGDKSRGDEGFDGLAFSDYDATVADFITVYGNIDDNGDGSGDGYDYNNDNLNTITEQVNFYLSAEDASGEKKDELTIFYVFKFVFTEGSPTDVNITIANESDILGANDTRKDKVSMSYKFVQGNKNLTEPDWSTVEEMKDISGVEVATAKTNKVIGVSGETNTTHCVYMYASMTVKRTSTLADAFVLENFHWKFNISLIATNFS